MAYYQRVGGIVVKIIRVALGILLMVLSFPLLFSGGFTRASIQHGFPSRPHWGLIAVGLVVLFGGAFWVRPLKDR